MKIFHLLLFSFLGKYFGLCEEIRKFRNEFGGKYFVNKRKNMKEAEVWKAREVQRSVGNADAMRYL